LSVLIGFKDYFISEARWESLVLQSIEKIRRDVYDSVFHPYHTFSGITEIALIVHSLSEVIPTLNRFLDRINELLCINVSSYLKQSGNREFLTSNNFELIYGLSGALRHMLEFNNDIQVCLTTNGMVEALTRRSKERNWHGYKIPGWHYYPSKVESIFMEKVAENGLINYGVSHGMGGPMMVLSMAHFKNMHVNGLEEAIDGLFKEYRKASYYSNGIIYWPGRIRLEQYIGQEDTSKYPNQMGWCYGSIGILRIMYMTSIYTKNKEIESFSLSELEKVARLDIKSYLLSSPNVCHGFAGTVSIMSEMFNDTGNDIFFEAARKQAILCTNYIINADYSYVASRREDQVHLYSYLEGYSGILQTLNSFINDGSNLHKKRILVI